MRMQKHLVVVGWVCGTGITPLHLQVGADLMHMLVRDAPGTILEQVFETPLSV